MARRQQTSPFEDLITLTSKLPWKVSIFLAVGSYLGLHAVASRPAPHLTAPNQLGEVAAHSMVTAGATVGQFLLPLVFCIGALISAFQAAKQRKLYATVQSRTDTGALNDMSWEEFETLVAEHFQRKGFKVTREGGNGPDGGVDLVLRKGGEKHLVQCKQWRAYQVGVQPVREFYGVMAASGAVSGYFVTSGKFSEDAVKFVKGLNLELIDGRKLKLMIAPTARSSAPFTPRRGTEPIPFPPKEDPATSPMSPPNCPKCGAEMKQRTGRQGQNAGKPFWGCSTYPKCNGTRPIEDDAATFSTPTAQAAAAPEKRTCPHCETELVLKRFQSGPKEGQEFLACMPCRKGWPVV